VFVLFSDISIKCLKYTFLLLLPPSLKWKSLDLTLNKEYKLKVFESRVLRGMSGAKWKEVAGGCRIVFNL